MVARPQVLLLDEPTLGLAPKLVTTVMQALPIIAARNIAVLVVEQNARAVLHVFHSDRDLEAWEELRTGYQVRPQNRRLTHDYMKLFEELIDPSRQPVGWLAKEIGLAENPDERDRPNLYPCRAARRTKDGRLGIPQLSEYGKARP